MPAFQPGDRIVLEQTASVPTAEVLEIIDGDDGEKMYRLEWSNGTINTRPVAEMDQYADD